MTEMLSAAALAQAVHAGRLSPFDVAERCAEAIRAHEDEVRAFASLDLDALLEAAAAPGLAATPLAGLPVGVKDILDTVDFPTERGSKLFTGHRPTTDAAIVRMAARAGGLIAGKLVTTEFAFMQPSGTRNPRRLTHSPGGSSAGSAAAVAAGMLPVTLGTQTGGSIIRPASFCGVTGYKPSFKLLPVLGLKPFAWSLDTIGLFGAHVADVAFAAGALTGRDFALTDDMPTPRIAVVKTARAHLATDDAHAALDGAARAAEKAGASVSTLDLPDVIEAADEAHGVVQGYEASLAFADEWDRHRAALSTTLATYLEGVAAITPEQYDAARRTARRARHALSDLYGDYDVLLTFSVGGEAPEGFASTGSPAFNRLWTLTGGPCLNITGMTGATGMPIGVQLVGRFGRDRELMQIGRFLERAICAA